MRAGKKVQLVLIGNLPRAFQWTINAHVTPKSPEGGTKRDFAVFLVKFNFCRKKSATKFFLRENF